MFKTRIVSLIIITISFFTLLPAQNMDSTLVTIDRIYKDMEFDSETFGPARWLEDGSGYTTLEKSESVETGQNIIKYDPKTGKRFILVLADKLIPENNTDPLEIEDYSWSPDGNILLIFTNGKRVWRTNTRGDYWTLNMKTGRLSQLGKKFKPSSLMFAKVSPNEKKAAYVVKNNIYVEDLFTQSIEARRQLNQYKNTEFILEPFKIKNFYSKPMTN